MEKINLKIQLFFFLLIGFVACSNENEIIDEDENVVMQKDYEVVVLSGSRTKAYIEQPELALRFASEDAFNNVYELITELPRQDQLTWTNNLSHLSIAEVYEQAMEEAADLEFTEAEYKAFKNKYGTHPTFPNTKMIMALICLMLMMSFL